MSGSIVARPASGALPNPQRSKRARTKITALNSMESCLGSPKSGNSVRRMLVVNRTPAIDQGMMALLSWIQLPRTLTRVIRNTWIRDGRSHGERDPHSSALNSDNEKNQLVSSNNHSSMTSLTKVCCAPRVSSWRSSRKGTVIIVVFRTKQVLQNRAARRKRHRHPFHLYQTPPILILHLNKFHVDEKILTHCIDRDSVLDLREVVKH